MPHPKPPSVADVLASKGRYRYIMLRVENWVELAAAQAAGIDMCSVPPEMMVEQRFRDVAPTLFAVPGMALYNGGATDDYLRFGFKMMNAGADAICCAASFQTVRRLADEAVSA
jgi:3-methyl-2-oxobutanoate hydroxymethyltransferase